jgi:hypothetical protein
MAPVTALVGGYPPLPEPLTAITCIAKSAKLLRFGTPERLYSENTLLERLAQDLKDMAAELGELIRKSTPL